MLIETKEAKVYLKEKMLPKWNCAACIISFFFKLTFVVPTPTITITPSSPIQGAMVGSPQDIQCTAGTVDGVEFSTVLISWTGSGGDTITNDSRVTISPTTSSGNDYISTLQFAYLMEGDEGMYTCNVMILDATASETVEIQSLIGMYFVT